MFFSAATVAGAFGGLLARLINLMDGTLSYFFPSSVSRLNMMAVQASPGMKDGDGKLTTYSL